MQAAVILAAGSSSRMGFPKQLAEVRNKPLLQAIIDKVNINFDNFYTTHSDENKEYAEDIYKKCKEANLIFKKEIEQFYDSEEGLFLSDRFIKGQCPKCGAEDQYGDGCSVCGTTYSPDDLINPFSSLSNSDLIKKKLNMFFLTYLK